jgi:3-dehydroquinate dehydratase/shikimate dehydrogenase
MPNRIAASLAPPDTETCLEVLRRLAPRIAMAEVRLDLMETFDLARLIGEAPCPLIITCRPPREGGRFPGSEAERLAVLAEAMRLGCAYVDIEWDSVAALPAHPRTRVIASRHWTDRMPDQLWPAYAELRAHADAVKLVGMARSPADMLPIFDLLRHAPGPLVAIAMGEAGRLTRVLAPCFASCLLTYGASEATTITAAGQLSVDELADVYHLRHVGPHTAVHLHLCASAASAKAVTEKNAAVTPGADLHVPLIVSPEQAAQIIPGLRACFPHLTITADSALCLELADRSR